MNEHALSVAAARGYLLAGLAGAVPAAPAWFHSSLAVMPEREFIPVDGVDIETLSWGQRGMPGMILLHGQGACADWWSFIAPFFASRFRITALSWSGMGRSGWRASYDLQVYAREMLVVARECGQYDAPCPPIAIAHSFGGMPLLLAAADKESSLKGAILIDSYFPSSKIYTPPPRDREADKIRSFSSLPEALARFRLLPPQACANLFLVDYIARHSLVQHDPRRDSEGWRWRVDPGIRKKTVKADGTLYLRRVACPLALISGVDSSLCTADHQRMVVGLAPKGTPCVAIRDAAHHVLLDQPLALATALDQLLEDWRSI